MEATGLKRLALHAWHLARGGKMVPFAGYDMPVQYPAGVMKEHLHTRSSAGLFDVSHMGQIRVTPLSGKMVDAALALERLVPADVLGLKPGRQRYSQFLNEAGGVLDDLMFAHAGDHVFLVVNAGNKEADFAHLSGTLSSTCKVEWVADHALFALQGPRAAEVLDQIAPGAAAMKFMDARPLIVAGKPCFVSRSGYTGEDGYELSVPVQEAALIADLLCAHEQVLPIGLGARDSLRLEAGLCLHGNDLTPEISPVEAAIEWSIQKVRRTGGARAGGFPGAARVLGELDQGPARRRIGLKPDGRAPVRGGAPLFANEQGGTSIGVVTSGGFGPSVQAPVAMGLVESAHTAIGTRLFAEVRGTRIAVAIVEMPFITPGYAR